MEWRSRYVVLTILDENDVVAPLPDHVFHGVPLLSHVFDDNLFTGNFWPVNSHVQDVVASSTAVHQERVGGVHPGVLDAGSSAVDLGHVGKGGGG